MLKRKGNDTKERKGGGHDKCGLEGGGRVAGKTEKKRTKKKMDGRKGRRMGGRGIIIGNT